MEILQTALDNEDNSYIMNLTTEEINNINKPKVIATAIAEGVLIQD